MTIHDEYILKVRTTVLNLRKNDVALITICQIRYKKGSPSKKKKRYKKGCEFYCVSNIAVLINELSQFGSHHMIHIPCGYLDSRISASCAYFSWI